MPRRKQPNGKPAQPVRVPTGGEYGQASALRASQQAAPLHQAPDPAAAPTDPVMAGAAAAEPVPFQMGLLRQPTNFPDEDVSVGLPSGPGAGPEALVMSHQAAGRTASTLEYLASVTGDATFAALAAKARTRGL